MLSKKYPIWLALSVCLVLISSVLSFPGLFGFSKSGRIVALQGPVGFVLAAEMPREMAKERKREFLFQDSPFLCENGQALSRPGASYKQITNAGRGRYQFSGQKIHFSTSDGAPPGAREYTVRAPMWSLREPLLLAIWFITLVACAITVRLALPDGVGRSIQSPRVAQAALGISLAMAATAFCLAPVLSDLFFLGLTIPVIWAAVMGVLAVQKHFAGRAGLVVLSVVPAFAGFFYYGLNAASDSSFLVAGIIPCSDARLHFLQAAEIAVHGTTQVLFNGRFLYPAFYAAILNIAGLNILVANLLVSLLVMLGLAFACRLVAKRVGFAGAAVFCLLFWLYFRVHGCGLVMTENLGLLLGTLGFGFLLLSVDRNKIWPVYVALLFFGLASVARPGALFILPALALYAGVRVWILARPKTATQPGRAMEGNASSLPTMAPETTKRKKAIASRFSIVGLMAHSQPMRMAAAAVAVFVGLLLVVGCFGANNLVMKSLSSGEGKAFGNFAFTLHGLLNGTKWSTSADAYGWDTSLVMEQNIKQIKESPLSLVRGVFRAYEETLKKGFLFRFGPEKRLASTGMAMFIFATLGCWLWKPLRGDAFWIILVVAAIVASIPFAPPWDAGVRPYAASVPVQIFLAAAGFAMLLDLFRRLAEMVVTGELAGFMREAPVGDDTGSMGVSPVQTQDGPRSPFSKYAGHLSSILFAAFKDAPGLIALSALCFSLVLPAPLILKLAGIRYPVPAESPALLPGSRLLVSGEVASSGGQTTRANYFDRLSEFQAAYPDEAKFFASQPAEFMLAIDWRNLETVLLPCADGAKGAALAIP